MSGEGLNKDLAILVLNACYRASRELGEMIVMVREYAPNEEGKNVKIQTLLAMAEVGSVTDLIFKIHPDLETYVESQIDRFGRVS